MQPSSPPDMPAPGDPYQEGDPASPIDPDPARHSHHAYVELLFNRYRVSLHRYLTRLVPTEDAAELVQETYFRLLRHKEMKRIESMARSFLFQTATNLARDYRRRRVSRRAEQHVPIEEDEVGQSLGPDEYLAGEQLREVLEQAIQQLPPDTRTVFLLHRFRDLSYPEIARVMGLSARTVARKMAEAIERLASVLRHPS
jgi:RNA polymerase sigma-70 factor, ECF subfamily